MKSVQSRRMLAAALFLALIALSSASAQSHAQMDSMYAVLQRGVLKLHPTAVFPPIPYDLYGVVIDEFDGKTNTIYQIVGEAHEPYNYHFPQFTRWDIKDKEWKKDSTYRMYVSVVFYVVDSKSGTLMSGLANSILLHKKKKNASEPDAYKPEYERNNVVVPGYPEPMEPYQCENLRALITLIPSEHPLYKLGMDHCPEVTE